MTAFSYCLQPMGSRDNLLAEPQTPDRKVVSSNPGRSSRRIFFSRVNFLVLTLIWCLYHPLLWQWHVKDPNHSAKSAGGRLYMNTHVCTLNSPSQSRLTMLVCRHSVWTYQEMSSHATHQGTLGRSRLSSLSRQGVNGRTLSQTPRKRGKKPPPAVSTKFVITRWGLPPSVPGKIVFVCIVSTAVDVLTKPVVTDKGRAIEVYLSYWEDSSCVVSTYIDVWTNR